MASLAIIGRGVVGASIAYHASKIGGAFKQITLIDRLPGVSPGGATGASFGWINNFKETKDLHLLHTLSLARLRVLSQVYEGKFPVQWGGTLQLAWEAKDAIDLQARVNLQRTLGWPVTVMSSADLEELEPNLSVPQTAYAAFSEGEGHADGSLLSQFFINEATRQANVQMLGDCVVNSIKRNPKGKWNVAIQPTRGGMETTFEYDRVVIATGAITEKLAATAGVKIPLENVSGALVMLSVCPPDLMRRVVITPGLVMLQRRDGHVMLGTAVQGDSATTAQTASEYAHKIKQRAEKLLPALRDAKIEHALLETRPVPRGGLPMVGYVPNAQGLYVAVMHQGISLCGSIGMLAAEELADPTVRSYPLDSFRPPV